MADIIDELAGMDDNALGAKLGFDDKVKSFREDLKRAQALTGKPRDKVASAVEKMFQPNVYPDELRWKIEDAERLAKGKTTPSEIVGCCADCG